MIKKFLQRNNKLKKLNFRPFILTLITLLLTSCMIIDKRDEGNLIIEDLYKYKENNGIFPDGLYQIGVIVDETGPFYYFRSADSLSFRLSYPINMNDNHLYKSKTKKWTGIGISN